MRLRLTRVTLAAVLVLAVIVASDSVLGQDPAVPSDRAHIQVKLPAEAVLVIGSSATESKGPDRLFESPTLKKGTDYTYVLIATWTEDGKERKENRTVVVKAGRKTVVDFSKPDENPKDKDAPAKDKDAKPKDKDMPMKDKDAKPKDKDAPVKDKDLKPKDKDAPVKDKDTKPKDKDMPTKDKDVKPKDKDAVPPKDKDLKPKDKDVAPPKDKDLRPKDKDGAPKDKDAAPPKDKDVATTKDKAAPKDKDVKPKDKDMAPRDKDAKPKDAPPKDAPPKDKDANLKGKDKQAYLEFLRAQPTLVR